MAHAALTPTQQIIGKIQGLEERLTPIEGLLKALSEPARKAGLSPEALLAKMVDGNSDGQRQAVGFGPGMGWDGSSGRPFGARQRWKDHSGIGLQEDENTGQRAKFSEYLQNLYHFVDYGPGATKHIDYLHRLGVERMQTGPDGMIQKTALAESSGITGGYTVPPMFASQLLTLAVEGTVVAPRAAKQPLTARTLQIPSLDLTTAYGAGQSPFLGGILASWTAEAATRAESEPQFRQTQLTAWELSFYTVASNTLLADNAVGLDSLLTQLFSAAIGWYTDYAYLRGSGAGQPLGIINAPALIAVTRLNPAHFTFIDVATMMGNFYWMLRGSNACCWVISPSVIPEVLRFNDMSGIQTTEGFGRVMFVPIDRGAQADIPTSAGVQSLGYLLGFPVIVSEKLPALGTQGCVLFCDFSKYLLGTRQELQIDVSPHVNFLKNQMTWRVIWRGDGQPWLNNSITLADGTSKVSPFLTLTQ